MNKKIGFGIIYLLNSIKNVLFVLAKVKYVFHFCSRVYFFEGDSRQ